MYKKLLDQRSLWVVFILVAMVAIAFPTTAGAVEFVDGSLIAAGETIDDDVFIAGDTVVVDGTVNGNLFVAGSSVTINGVVKGSVMAAAQTITFNGQVDGSLYGGSSSMVLTENAKIGRNVYYGGFSLETKTGSTIGKDLLMGGYQGILGGEVSRDVNVGAGALQINGKVGRNVRAEVSAPDSTAGMPPFFAPPGAPPMIASGLQVSDSASIGGTLTYVSESRQDSSVVAQPEGGVVYQTPTPSQTQTPSPSASAGTRIGQWFLARFQELVTLLVLGGLALWLIPNHLSRWAGRVKEKPVDSALWGLVTSLVGYLGAGLLALSVLALALFLGVLTLGGLSRTIMGLGFSTLAFGFTIFNLLVTYGSKVVVAFLLGMLIVKKLLPQYAENKVWLLVTGVLIYVLLRSIPFLGWLIGLLVTLLGLGAIWLVFREDRKPAVMVESTAS